MALLSIYRQLPWFKGKLRLGKWMFKKYVEKEHPINLKAHYGIQYYLPNTIENVGIELLINGIYEQDIVRFLQHQIPDGAVYVDIGANIGSIGLPIIKHKKNIQYHAFEASPMVFEYLAKNIESNKIINATLINKLVHKDDAQSMKFYHGKYYGKSSLAPTYSTEYVMVDSVSMDGYCRENNLNEIDWMKIDVQGFELYVFEGMQQLLQQKKINNILFEYEAWAEEEAGLKAGTAKNYMLNIGYDLFTLDGKIWNDNNISTDTMIWAKPSKAV